MVVFPGMSKAIPTSVTTSAMIIEPQNELLSVEKMIVLRKKGLSYQEIADSMKCSKSNVHYRLQPYIHYDGFADNTDDFYEILQYRLYKSLDESAIQKMQPYQRVIAISILEDKKRLIRGQNTAKIDINNTICSIASIQKQEQVLEAKYKLLTGKDLGK